MAQRVDPLLVGKKDNFIATLQNMFVIPLCGGSKLHPEFEPDVVRAGPEALRPCRARVLGFSSQAPSDVQTRLETFWL